MKTVFQVLRVDSFCCVWLAIQCYTMQDSFCHAYDLMCRLILVIRSPKLHVCQKYGPSSSLKSLRNLQRVYQSQGASDSYKRVRNESDSFS